MKLLSGTEVRYPRDVNSPSLDTQLMPTTAAPLGRVVDCAFSARIQLQGGFAVINNEAKNNMSNSETKTTAKPVRRVRVGSEERSARKWS